MGTGIMAAVPLVFEPHIKYGRQEKLEEKYFSKGFLSNFVVEETESGIKYVIQKDLLLNNYKQFRHTYKYNRKKQKQYSFFIGFHRAILLNFKFYFLLYYKILSSF